MNRVSADKLRILFVDTEMVWRGGQEQLLSLVVGMKQRGHLVELAAPPQAPLTERAGERGVRCHPFRQRSEFSPAALLKLTRILAGRGFQIVYFNTPRSILAGSLAARLTGAPRRVCSRRVNFPLKSRLSRFKYNWLLDAIFTVSESIRQTLIEDRVRAELIHVIYEGVDLPWIDALSAPGLPPGCRRPVIGMVAHLSGEKGHRVLLEAFGKLIGGFPEGCVLLVGDGPLRDQLLEFACREGLEERVCFAGFRDDSEALMKEFDIFCLPSLSEGLSSAILSAMANRLPVIATDVGGIPELVVDGQTGALVPPQDPVSLSEAMARLLRSERLRKIWGEAGRLRIERQFTLNQKLDHSEALLSSLLDRDIVG